MFYSKNQKILVVSTLCLNDGRVQIKGYLNPIIKINGYKGLFEFIVDTNDSSILNKIKIGKWVRLNDSFSFRILYIYQTKNNKLIYKYTKHDNEIYIGDSNTYDHKLIFKGKYCNNNLIPLYSCADYYKNILFKR